MKLMRQGSGVELLGLGELKSQTIYKDYKSSSSRYCIKVEGGFLIINFSTNMLYCYKDDSPEIQTEYKQWVETTDEITLSNFLSGFK